METSATGAKRHEEAGRVYFVGFAGFAAAETAKTYKITTPATNKRSGLQFPGTDL
jgi:hypothetical protein